MGRSREVGTRWGTLAATVAVVVAVALAGVGVATASQDETAAQAEALVEAGNNFFEPETVTIDVGDTVRWEFVPNGLHNAVSTSSNWSYRSGDVQFNHPPATTPPDTFDAPGTYTYVCEAHAPEMSGTIIVEEGGGNPTPTPTPTPDPTPTPEPTPSPTPPPGGGGGGGGGGSTAPHVEAPPPSIAASADTTRPAISRVSGKGLRNRRVRVRFSLTETATVSVKFRRAGRKGVLRTARVMGHQGRNTITVRSRSFKKGRRYTVQLRARDAVGNRSATARKTFRKRR